MNPTTTVDGVRIYRGKEAPLLEESGAVRADFGGNDNLKEIAVKLAGSDCSVSKLLVHQKPGEGGMSVVYLFFKPHFPLFRHAHDVDSLYVVISGEVVGLMNKERLGPGDSWAVTAGTQYYYEAGPDGVEVLEIFRDADQATVIYSDGNDGRLEHAQQVVQENEESWKDIKIGPLFGG